MSCIDASQIDTNPRSSVKISPPRSGIPTLHQCADVANPLSSSNLLILHQTLPQRSKSLLISPITKISSLRPMLRRHSHLLHHRDRHQHSRTQRKASIIFQEATPIVISLANPIRLNSPSATHRQSFPRINHCCHLSQL